MFSLRETPFSDYVEYSSKCNFSLLSSAKFDNAYLMKFKNGTLGMAIIILMILKIEDKIRISLQICLYNDTCELFIKFKSRNFNFKEKLLIGLKNDLVNIMQLKVIA